MGSGGKHQAKRERVLRIDGVRKRGIAAGGKWVPTPPVHRAIVRSCGYPHSCPIGRRDLSHVDGTHLLQTEEYVRDVVARLVPPGWGGGEVAVGQSFDHQPILGTITLSQLLHTLCTRPNSLATMDQVKTSLAVVGAVALGTGLLVLGRQALADRRNTQAQRRADRLAAELEESKAALESKDAEISQLKRATRSGKKPVRVYVDGCFDMMHFGHR